MSKTLQDHRYFQVKRYSLFSRGSFGICVPVLIISFSKFSLNECITNTPIFCVYTTVHEPVYWYVSISCNG